MSLPTSVLALSNTELLAIVDTLDVHGKWRNPEGGRHLTRLAIAPILAEIDAREDRRRERRLDGARRRHLVSWATVKAKPGTMRLRQARLVYFLSMGLSTDDIAERLQVTRRRLRVLILEYRSSADRPFWGWAA